MTFDEAIAELKQDRVFKDSVAEGFALDIIKKLQKEYAPTVYMTKEQYTFIDELFKESKALGATFEEFSVVYKYYAMLKRVALPIKTREEAMQAWLHPETIKVLGEDDD